MQKGNEMQFSQTHTLKGISEKFRIDLSQTQKKI